MGLLLITLFFWQLFLITNSLGTKTFFAITRSWYILSFKRSIAVKAMKFRCTLTVVKGGIKNLEVTKSLKPMILTSFGTLTFSSWRALKAPVAMVSLAIK